MSFCFKAEKKSKNGKKRKGKMIYSGKKPTTLIDETLKRVAVGDDGNDNDHSDDGAWWYDGASGGNDDDGGGDHDVGCDHNDGGGVDDDGNGDDNGDGGNDHHHLDYDSEYERNDLKRLWLKKEGMKEFVQKNRTRDNLSTPSSLS